MTQQPETTDTLHADAQRIVTQICGTDADRVSRMNAGVMTFKYLVSLPAKDYIVRFYPPGREHVVAYEPDLINRCRERGMRVPKVIASSRTGPMASLQYMAYEMVPGVPLSGRLPALSEGCLSRICSTLIDELRFLERVEISGFGELIESTWAASESWLSFVKQTFADGIEFVRDQSLLPLKVINGLDSIGQRIDSFSYTGTSALCWGDISAENIIVSEDQEIAGLLDFEGVLGAEFDLNLGYLRARYSGSKFYSTVARCWPGACETTSARSALYVLVRALRLSLHTCQPLPTGTPRTPLETFLPGFKEAFEECLMWIGEGRSVLHR
jgi:hypothetical protein